MKKFLTILTLFIASFGHAQEDLISTANTLLESQKLTEAKNTIERAFQNSNIQQNPRAWYIKGRIFHEILKSKNPDLDVFKKNLKAFAQETVKAYKQTKLSTTLGEPLFISAENQISALWADAINEGVNLYQANDFDNAITAFEIAQIARPNDSTGYFYAALSAQKAENYDLALSNYRTLQTMASPTIAIHNGIITCLQGKDDLEELLKAVNEATADFPDHMPYFALEIRTLASLNQFNDAESRVKAKLSQDPNSYELISLIEADLYDRFFKYYFINGELDRSENYYKKAGKIYKDYLRQFPNDFLANFNYAIMINERANQYRASANRLMNRKGAKDEARSKEMRKIGNDLTREALPYMERARVLQPQDEKVILSLRIFYQRLNMEEALANLPDNN